MEFHDFFTLACVSALFLLETIFLHVIYSYLLPFMITGPTPISLSQSALSSLFPSEVWQSRLFHDHPCPSALNTSSDGCRHHSRQTQLRVWN
jgi:hypothetical protein